MVPGAEHVRQREERRHQRIVLTYVERIEGAIRLRDAERFRLRAVKAGPVAEKAAVNAGGLQAFLAEEAGTVGICEGHDHDLPALDALDGASDLLDHADRLMPHPLPFDVGSAVVRPQVTAAD